MNFSPIYEQQVRLLLRVLPEVAHISDFAMHGGTAINLFHRNLPRLSVDIDLTYVPIEPRKDTLLHIAYHLQTLQHTLESSLRLQVQNQSEKGKLLISDGQARIKIEVNLVKRGCITPPQTNFCVMSHQNFLMPLWKYRLFRLDNSMVEKFVQPWIASIHVICLISNYFSIMKALQMRLKNDFYYIF